MKTRRLSFHPDFADDLAVATAYFLENLPHRVEELHGDYDATLDEIIENPEQYAIRDDGLRRKNLETFSYSIRFDWIEGALTVVAFAHHYEDTARWIHRLADLLTR